MKSHTNHTSTLSLVIVLAIAFGFSACKGKKKLSEMSDTQEVKEEIAAEEAEEKALEEEKKIVKIPEERVVVREPSKEQKLHNYFGAIASASSTTSANASIDEALTLFSSADAPVLIVIYKEGGKPSYDEPTTISKYLNYLKDTKNDQAKVDEMVYDSNGRIKELVLKK